MRQRTRSQSDPEGVESIAANAAAETAGPVHEALVQLPPPDRELLYLFDVDGFSAREIGVMLGISHGAVHVRVFRARERFRSIYRPEGDTE